MEVIVLLSRCSRTAATCCVMQNTFHQVWLEHHIATGSALYRLQYSVKTALFQQIATYTRSKATQHQIVLIVGSQDDNGNLWPLGTYAFNCLQPIHNRHTQIHQ